MPPPDLPHDAGRRMLLRGEVAHLRAGETRRVFDPSVQVGVLGGDRTGFPLRAKDRPRMDTALLRDVAQRLVEESHRSWRTTWVQRPGEPGPHDLDLQWLAAVHWAFGSHDRPLAGCFVVTRSGWRDVLTDETWTWLG